MVEPNTAETASPNKEAAVSAEQPERNKPIAKLLGTISYDNVEDFESFQANMTPQQIIIVLISAANYAQAKGAFNLEESELISRAIKRLKTHTEEALKSQAEPQP